MFIMFEGSKCHDYLSIWQLKYFFSSLYNNLCIRLQNKTLMYNGVPSPHELLCLLAFNFTFYLKSQVIDNVVIFYILPYSNTCFNSKFLLRCRYQISALRPQVSVSERSLSSSFVNWKINGSPLIRRILFCDCSSHYINKAQRQSLDIRY